ncbi:MAG: hypothetical protein IT305_21830 [Chloroflexi bacterium]|nr:hypothetical protein [Chloroflexota bacterium]
MTRFVPALSGIEWRLFLLLLVCYVYFLPRYADWSQSSRTALILAIVHDGRFEIDDYSSTTGDYAEVNAHRYSDKAPGPALLGVPVYAAARWALSGPVGERLLERLSSGAALRSTLKPAEATRGKVDMALAQAVATWAVVSGPAAALGVCFFRVVGRVGVRPATRLIGTLGYGLATSAFPYAGALYSHQLAAALLFGAFALLWSEHQPSTARLVLVGGMVGLALISEYPTALIAGGLGLYALRLTGQRVSWCLLSRGLRTAGFLGLGAAPPLALMAVHNWAIFGTPLPVGYAHSTLWQSEHQTGFFSLTWPTFEAFWGVTFGLYRGLFVTAPYLLLGLAGLVYLLRDPRFRTQAVLCGWSVACFLAFNSSSVMWTGGYGVGPRYLVPMLPFLALPATVAIDRWSDRRAGRLICGTLLAWSFAATWSLTIAGQSFPGFEPFPLWTYALPALLAGDIARNVGTLGGLSGWWSMVPLGLLAVLLVPWQALRDHTRQQDRGRTSPPNSPATLSTTVSTTRTSASVV